eukprot:7629661-Pyramimonas_sp.AAC.1
MPVTNRSDSRDDVSRPAGSTGFRMAATTSPDSRDAASRPAGRQVDPSDLHPPGLPPRGDHPPGPPTPGSPSDVNAFLMCKMAESLAEVASAMQSNSGGSKQPLQLLPKGPRTLPTVKSWRHW